MDETILKTIQTDFITCHVFLRKVSGIMRKDKITKYPIFVVMENESTLDLGVPIIRSEEVGTTFTFNASHLEDLVNKDIISAEKTKQFIDNYKHPDNYCCVFVALEAQSSIIYIPYEAEKLWEPIDKSLLN